MRRRLGIVVGLVLAVASCSSEKPRPAATGSPSSSPAPLPAGVVASIETGNTPESATLAFGSIWVQNHRPGTVTRIDPATNNVIATIDVGGGRIGPAALAGGKLWYGSADAKKAVAVDPATNQPTTLAIACECEEEPGLIALGGELLFLPSESEMWHVDPATARITSKTAIQPGARLVAVAERLYALRGNMIARIDARTGKASGASVRVPLGAGAVDVTVAGATIWLTSSDGTIARFDTRTGKAAKLTKVNVSDLILDPEAPLIVAASSTDVYVRPDASTIIRVDPVRGIASERFDELPLGQYASYMLVAAGSLWAPNFSASTMWRIDPAGLR